MSKKIERPPLGARIKSDYRLWRGSVHEDRPDGWGKKWHRIDGEPGEYAGMYIGYRTYSNGRITFVGDGGLSYEATEHLEAWLIVPDERSAPIPVLPSDARVVRVKDGAS